MNTLALIHVARKQLGLDEETYRGLLVRVTGKRSAGDMDEGERRRVVDELRRLGFEPASKGGRTPLDGPYAGKLQALWIAGWNLGIVRDRADGALLAFVERQTGISHTRFLRDPADALKAVEALKAWLAREGGVDWSRRQGGRPHGNDPRYRIAVATWLKLIAIGAVRPTAPRVDRIDLSGLEGGFGYRVTGKGGFQFYEDRDWIALMNALGAKLRGAQKRRRAA